MKSLPDTGRVYIAIDLKSFYASVECVERGLDPLKAKLVGAEYEDKFCEMMGIDTHKDTKEPVSSSESEIGDGGDELL